MIEISADLRAQFDQLLINKAVPDRYHIFYRKWLRYYLDFCQKYHLPHANRETLPHFIKKLQEKRQTPEQQKQAYHAVSFYYRLLQSGKKDTPLNPLLVEGNYNDSHLYYVATPDDIRGQAPLDIQKIVGADLCV